MVCYKRLRLIPQFNQDGYLPVGIHKATQDEIKIRFGTGSNQRIMLFERLVKLLKLLKKQSKHIKLFLLNGSFVYNKDSPNDLDCILVLKKDFDYSSPESHLLSQTKKVYHTHLFIFDEEDESGYKEILDFFCSDRAGDPKGILEVLL